MNTSAVLAGFAFSLSLIAVIGPQNVLVIRVGMLRRGVLAVIAICIASDITLILAGTAGAGAVIDSADWVLTLVRLGGAAFLLSYAALALRRVVRAEYTQTEAADNSRTIGAIVAAACAMTFLNPGVYLDTVVLMGSVAHTHAPRQWWFAAGAGSASAVWFTALGLGARRLSHRLSRPATWRALDAFVVIVMTVTAIRLLGTG